MLVLVFHFNLFGVAKAGFIGVDVFFVISGFLISSIIWKQLEIGRFSLGAFYLRRFRRLAPAFVCVQLFILGFAYVLMLPNEVADLIKQTFFAQTYLINFYLWKSINYFGLQADSVPLLHCWSLAVEEQFYLTYPLLLIVIHRFARRQFAFVLIALTVLSFALNVLLVKRHTGVAFYLLPTRAWELSLGAMLPFAQAWFVPQRWLRHVAALGGTLAIAAGVGLYTSQVAFPGFFALYPTVGTAALILAGTGGRSWASVALSQKPLVYIGRISYSLYLVHWPVRVLVEAAVHDYTLSWRWTSFILSLVLSSMLFHLVEDPIRSGAIFPGGRKFAIAYAMGFALVMMLAFSAFRTTGWSFRFEPAAIRLASYETDQDDGARRCEYSGPNWRQNLDNCRLGAPGRPNTWLLFGDSHAWALADSFSIFLRARGEAGTFVFVHSCMPVIGLGDANCQDFTAEVLRYVAQNPQIKTVAMVSIWRQPFEGEYLQGQGGRILKGPERLEAFHRQFHATLQQLHDSGKAVVLWKSLPSAKRSVPKALAWSRISGRQLDISITKQEYEQTFKFMSDAVADNRALINATVSPATAICPTDDCLIEKDGIPLYFDNNHPSHSQARFFSTLLESQISGAI